MRLPRPGERAPAKAEREVQVILVEPEYRRNRRPRSEIVLTEEVLETVRIKLETLPNKSALAKLLGVHPDTLYDWYAAGGKEGAPAILVRLRETMDRALAVWEEKRLDEIRAAAGEYEEESVTEDAVRGRSTRKSKRRGDWRAAAWLLEKKIPKKYNAPAQVEHSGQVDLVAAITQLRVDAPERQKVIDVTTD